MVATTLRVCVYRLDSFSPYLDPEPIAEYFDHGAHRFGTAISFAIIVHFGLFMMLHSQFTLPELPHEPEPIEVQIISFEPEPEIVPEVELRPTVPSPALAPIPKPKPKPKPVPPPPPKPVVVEPEPIPEPILEPEPIPELEPVVIPPKIEVLTSEIVEPEPEVVIKPSPQPEPPKPPKPVVESEPLPEPTPEPVIEIAKPLPEFKMAPVIELPPEPVVEKPVVDFIEPTPDPISEPVIEPVEPDPEPTLEPEIEIIEPVSEPLPEAPIMEDLPPAPVITETPISGAVTEEPLVEPIEELTSPIVEEIIPEPVIEIPVAPEPIPTPKPDIVEIETPTVLTTAPSILASPDAPTTKAEEKTAVPQSQAVPPGLILQNGMPKQPRGGGGNQGSVPIGAPPGGGARPLNPGAKGWRLAPGSWGKGTGEGYKGLILDMRCREAGRTHEDCPEYLQKYQGRNSEGFEEFGAHAPRGSSITRASRGMTPGIFSAPTIGELGSPSTTVLDDAGLNGTYLGDRISNGTTGGRVRDLFSSAKPAPWMLDPELPEAPEEDELKSFILKPKKKPDGQE